MQELKSRTSSDESSPWNKLHGWRLGGNQVSRQYEFSRLTEDPSLPVTPPNVVNLKLIATPDASAGFNFDVTLNSSEHDDGNSSHNVHICLDPRYSLELNGPACSVASIIDGKRDVAVHVKHKDNSATFSEKHHILSGDTVTALGIPWPKWMKPFGEDESDKSHAGNAVQALMPSKVIKVMVKIGDKVDVGDGLIVLEAMKTEVVMKALKAGTVSDVKAQEGGMVKEGQILIMLSPEV